MWDTSENAITVGERLGREAETWPVEIVHVASTTIVTTLTAGCVYLLSQLSVDSVSPVALVVLLLAGVLLTLGLQH